ncbi:MAG: zinc ribbon domain-containing protein [Dehalococcoidia bacterium]|nr:zinc ribbon domain-containing protein [Dehalococcoidia bacterium]
MSTPIEFTGNYQDLSTENGFQFKFICERCQNGYMSSYQQNRLGLASGLMRSASNFTGGMFGRGADSAYDIQQAIGGKQHDGALKRAVEEIRPLFKQCRHCGDWRCEQVCWNTSANMCKDCAPIAEEVETRVRAQFVETQVQNDTFLEENVRMSAKGKEVNANCTSCGAETLGKKFCPECGTRTATAVAAFCGECGAKSTPGSKFCAECGAKLTAS